MFMVVVAPCRWRIGMGRWGFWGTHWAHHQSIIFGVVPHSNPGLLPEFQQNRRTTTALECAFDAKNIALTTSLGARLMSESGSTLPRRQLGRYLRELRLQIGMALPEAARRIERSTSTLQRIETGQCDRIKLLDVQELCGIYDADEIETAGVLGLAQQVSVKSWWHEFGALIPEDFDVYMGLEAAANRLTAYIPTVVFGLLQTRSYTRALLHAESPRAGADEIERAVELKMKRQGPIVRRHQPTELVVVLLECALRRVVGSPKVMAAQLRHIADISTRDNVRVHVLPFQRGIPLGDPINQFVVLDFGTGRNGEPVEPPVVYLENYTGDLYLEESDTVARYHEAHRALAHASLDETSSRTLLRQIAREYVS